MLLLQIIQSMTVLSWCFRGESLRPPQERLRTWHHKKWRTWHLFGKKLDCFEKFLRWSNLEEAPMIWHKNQHTWPGCAHEILWHPLSERCQLSLSRSYSADVLGSAPERHKASHITFLSSTSAVIWLGHKLFWGIFKGFAFNSLLTMCYSFPIWGNFLLCFRVSSAAQ